MDEKILLTCKSVDVIWTFVGLAKVKPPSAFRFFVWTWSMDLPKSIGSLSSEINSSCVVGNGCPLWNLFRWLINEALFEKPLESQSQYGHFSLPLFLLCVFMWLAILLTEKDSWHSGHSVVGAVLFVGFDLFCTASLFAPISEPSSIVSFSVRMELLFSREFS